MLADATATFERCWWEANVVLDLNMEGNNTATINNALINAYTRQQFFSVNECVGLYITNSRIITSHVAPVLLNPPGTNNIFKSTGSGYRITLNNVTFSPNTTLGHIYNNTLNCRIQVSDMRRVSYRFKKIAIAAGATGSMETEGGTFVNYALPENGHLLALSIKSSSVMTAGLFTGTPLINGVATSLDTAYTETTTGTLIYQIVPYAIKVVAGDMLSVYFNYSGAGLPTPNSFQVEVVMGLGPDGTYAP